MMLSRAAAVAAIHATKRVLATKKVLDGSGVQIIRPYSTAAKEPLRQFWHPHLKSVVEPLVMGSTLRLPGVEFPEKKVREHEQSTVFGRGHHYGVTDDHFDAAQFLNIEHLLLARVSFLLMKSPHPDVLAAECSIAKSLYDLFKNKSTDVLGKIFEVGCDKSESRALIYMNSPGLLMKTLACAPENPQELVLALESILSPLGMLIRAYGTPFCHIAKAKAQGIDVGDLERLVRSLVEEFAPYITQHIRSKGELYQDLRFEPHKPGDELKEGWVTTHPVSLPRVSMGGTPDLRRLKTNDSEVLNFQKTWNFPLYFGVSGTTGALMLATLGFLHQGRKLDLVDSPEKCIRAGMVLAGGPYHLNGYHSPYEVYPALYRMLQIFKGEASYHLSEEEINSGVALIMPECVDPESEAATLVASVMPLIAEAHRLQSEIEVRERMEKYKKALVDSEDGVKGSPKSGPGKK